MGRQSTPTRTNPRNRHLSSAELKVEVGLRIRSSMMTTRLASIWKAFCGRMGLICPRCGETGPLATDIEFRSTVDALVPGGNDRGSG
jgi:hypothetical protein